jgi:hypothetical protein
MQDRDVIVDHSLVAHDLKTFQKTVMETAFHAAVAHGGSGEMRHFAIIFSGMCIMGGCCIIDTPPEEKKS